MPLPKSQTLNMAMEGQNIVNTTEGVGANGQPLKTVFRRIYDGMPHPTTGNALYDSTAFTWIGNTINADFKNGTVVEVAQFIIDPGKAYSGHTEGITPNGESYHFEFVWDRQ